MTLPETNQPDGPALAADVAARPLRADAQRNRDKLIAAARSAFIATDGAVQLESIAHQAGVGIGTLYRHFPNRESLAEAVYAAELDDVVASVPGLLETLTPDAALRAWMNRYSGFIATKRGMHDTLRAGWASGRIATPETRERITNAIGRMLAAGSSAGTLRDDVDPKDVTAMLLGVFLSTATSGEQNQTERLLDLVVDALRPPSPQKRWEQLNPTPNQSQ